MKEHNVGYELLNRFTGDQPVAALCLDIQDLDKKINGRSVPIAEGVRIDVNSNHLNRSKLQIARTLLHEMVHAELIAIVREAGGLAQLEQFMNDSEIDDDFVNLWEFLEQNEGQFNNPDFDWHHELMAEKYVEYIGKGLKEVHYDLSSPEWLEYGNSLETIHDQPFSWDDLFYYTAWVGLHNTLTYQKDIVDKGKKSLYEEYYRLVNQEMHGYDCE
ncbi:MAG: hypothetical protein WBH03_17960 [Cyclobacteriaceae bacterium]